MQCLFLASVCRLPSELSGECMCTYSCMVNSIYIYTPMYIYIYMCIYIYISTPIRCDFARDQKHSPTIFCSLSPRHHYAGSEGVAV